MARTRSNNLVAPTPDDLTSYATDIEVASEISGVTELKEINSKPAPYLADDGDSDVDELEDLADPKGSESGSIKLSIVSSLNFFAVSLNICFFC